MREWWFNISDPSFEAECHRLFDGRVRAWDGPEEDDPIWGRLEHDIEDGALIVKRSRGRWTLIHDSFADRVAELLGLPLAPRVPEGHPGWEPPAAPTAAA